MSKYWSDLVSGLDPYVPGEQPKIDDLTKLNTNENPYGPSPLVKQRMAEQITDELRLYPAPAADQLVKTLSSYYGVDEDQVFVGNGSDEVLAHVFNALLRHDEALLFPDITYSFYPVYCGLFDIQYCQVPLNDNFEIDVQDYNRPNGGIIFPNPNAPTGRLLPLQAVEQIVAANPDSVVVVDEAYIDFGGDSAVALIDRYANLLVIQTLSKSRALAGLRVGFALGNKELIDALQRVKNSFNSYPLGRLDIVGAAASFEDEQYFQRRRQQVIDDRQQLDSQLQALGFDVLPSAANFLFVRHGQRDAAELAAALREQGIIVRHFAQPRIEQFLRISIGTEQQNARLVRCLQHLLG